MLKQKTSDISGLQVTLFDPNNKAYLLHDKTGAGKAIKASYPPATPKSGDLTGWIGANPKGIWRLKVVDLKKGPGGNDGTIAAFALKVTWISGKKVAAIGDLSVGGYLELTSNLKAAVPCSAETTGRIWFDKSGPALRICDGADWQLLQFQSLCGNKKVNTGEGCDDGNTVSGDGCTSACKKNVCGDAIVHKGVEQCDDGNKKSGDGCSSACKPESFKSCKQWRQLANVSKSGVYEIDLDGSGPKVAFKVYCDMQTDGGGWTLVARGKGGSMSGWGTTGDLNTAAALGLGQTFKWSDAKINALVTERYRWTYDGSVLGAGAKGQGAWWYWNSAGCVYGHKTQAQGNCDRAYGDVGLTKGPIPGSNGSGAYMGLCAGGGHYIHTHHVGPSWYIRDHHTYAKGGGSTNCSGGQGGCDVALWVR